jgi:FKBP-type peptidyl-prolyl cis-trans isomerase
MQKLWVLSILLAGYSVHLCAQTKPAPSVKKSIPVKPVLSSGIDSFSYAIGMNVASFFKAQGVDTISTATFNLAIQDVLSGKKLLLDENTANMTVQQKIQEFMSRKLGKVKEEGRVFLEENKKQPGVEVLPSGIQYKIITQGTGVKPRLEDTIKVHYRGTTIDGQIFDDSYSRGEPIEFQLGGLIEGWKQTLVLMPAGSKWKLFIPSDYAYGDNGAGSKIPGGSTLVFELELLEVKIKTN